MYKIVNKINLKSYKKLEIFSNYTMKNNKICSKYTNDSKRQKSNF